MKCPNDNTTLVISERQNIEIDYCPECRGVWLDRGELDKLIERSVTTTPAEPTRHYEQPHSSHSAHHDDYDDHRRPHHKKRKESFLGDIFDF